MIKRFRMLGLVAMLTLAISAGAAVANNGLHKPPSSDSAMAIAAASVAEGSGVSLTFTFTLGSTPSTISNGNVEAEAPAGWTFTAATIDVSSTCNVSSATASFTSSEFEVQGLSCTSGQTLVVDLTATTPDVTASTVYDFDSSFKSSPGSRRAFNNVWRTQAEASVTVTAV
jgi:hypothetical protein